MWVVEMCKSQYKVYCKFHQNLIPPKKKLTAMFISEEKKLRTFKCPVKFWEDDSCWHRINQQEAREDMVILVAEAQDGGQDLLLHDTLIFLLLQ